MRKDLISFKPIRSSFLSCDIDIQSILKTLFVTSRPYSDILKRLLIINNKDCLDTSNEDYQKIIDSFSLGDLLDKLGIESGYYGVSVDVGFDNVASDAEIIPDDVSVKAGGHARRIDSQTRKHEKQRLARFRKEGQ